MPVPISLATIPVVAFLGGLYSGQASRGVVLAMVIHASWAWFYHRGDDFPSVYDFDLLIYWFFSSLLAGIVGSMMTLMFNWHPIMDGAHLSVIYRKDGKISFRKIGRVLGKLILVLLIFAGAHIIYELNVSGFPKWAGGIVGSILIVGGWVAFALLFRRESLLFMNPPSDSRGYHRFTRSEVMVYALYGALTHFLYFTAYWLADWFWPTLSGWLNDGWYFYMSLILFGGIGIIMWIVAFFLIRSRSDLIEKYKQVPAEETPSPARSERHMGSQMQHRTVQAPKPTTTNAPVISAGPSFNNPFV